MGEIFLNIINISITASWLVLAIVIIRLLLKKAPKWISCLLWALVGIRLICPFSFESVLSLVPSAQTIPVDNIYSSDPTVYYNTYYYRIDSGFNAIDTVVDPLLLDTNSQSLRQNFELLAIFWLIGIAFMLIYAVISYLRLRKKINEAVALRENIWACDRVATPFILGILRPKIILPSSMDEAEAEYVIAHEKAHLKRCDHFLKPLGFLILSIHWFNPIIWLAYILLCRDIELACDERVIKNMTAEDKRSYSSVLLNCSLPRKIISACPLAFGETGIKKRIKTVLSYKKPAFWIIIAAIILSVFIAISFLTNPSGIKLTQLEDSGRHDNLFDEVTKLEAVSGINSFYIEYTDRTNREIINEIVETLKEIRISKNPISPSRSDERDKTHTITINNGDMLCFSEDYSKYWLYTGVKPTLSYKVINPSKVKTAFDMIKENQILYTSKELLDMVNEISGNKEIALSSNPYDYINAKRDVYEKILSGRHNTVKCFISQLRNAESYGLDKYIMAAACSEITGIGLITEEYDSDSESQWDTAEEWLELYDKTMRDYADSTLTSNSSSIVFENLRLMPEQIAYDNGSYSFIQSADFAPDYQFVDGTELYERAKEETRWTKLGAAKEISLTEENFDSRLTQSYWKLKFSSSGIRRENAKAWELKIERNGLKELYLILQQKNGKYYLCYGYYDLELEGESLSQDNSLIRCIYTLKIETAGYNPSFSATVLEINENSITVAPFEGENIRKIADKVTVSTNVISANAVPKLKKGAEIRVVFNGTIQETYPANIPQVFAIYLLNEVS